MGIKYNQTKDKGDKATFLNELGLGECDDENSHDNTNSWDDCYDGDYSEEQTFESELAEEVGHALLFLLISHILNFLALSPHASMLS